MSDISPPQPPMDNLPAAPSAPSIPQTLHVVHPPEPTPAAAAPSPAASPRLATVQAIHWNSVFDFTHLFRGFRLAINPAKLGLAVLAILMIYTAGRIFDGVWGPQAYTSEIQEYSAETHDEFASGRAVKLELRNDQLDRFLVQETDLSSDQRDAMKDHPRRAYTVLRKAYEAEFQKSVKDAADYRASDEKESASSSTPPRQDRPSPAQAEQDHRRSAAKELSDNMLRLRDTTGTGIFDSFLQYETTQFDHLVDNTLTLVRISPVVANPQSAENTAAGNIQENTLSGSLITRDSEHWWRSDTIAGCIANMTVTAPSWLFSATAPMQWKPATAGFSGWIKKISYRGAYLLSLLLLAIFSIIVLAFTGASIARLSALEMAGIERAPLKDVFVYAWRRLWVFIKSPIMPFNILFGIGLIMTLVGLVGAVPWVGPIIIGAIFFIFLAISFILMLLLLGILGGFNLLYPAIAVEDADAFDAMSRAFAYVYARPWRLLGYSLIALVYGAITLLFVSFAAYLILTISHTFAGWGMNLFGMHNGAYSGSPELDTLWPAPKFLALAAPVNWWAMSWGEFLGSLLLHFWVYLFVAAIGAYVISYYFSSHTIMYLLLRRSVDGQNLREVFLDEKPPTPGTS